MLWWSRKGHGRCKLMWVNPCLLPLSLISHLPPHQCVASRLRIRGEREWGWKLTGDGGGAAGA